MRYWRSFDRKTERILAINAINDYINECKWRLLRSKANLQRAESELVITQIKRLKAEGWTLQWVQSESNTQPSRSTSASDQQA